MGADISKEQKRPGLRWQGLSENDFAYKRQKFDFFLRELNTHSPFEFVGLIFSYLGHYGVQIFIFLSAYGLYLSTRNKEIRYWKFVRERIAKLYPSFFLAVLF